MVVAFIPREYTTDCPGDYSRLLDLHNELVDDSADTLGSTGYCRRTRLCSGRPNGTLQRYHSVLCFHGDLIVFEKFLIRELGLDLRGDPAVGDRLPGGREDLLALIGDLSGDFL